MLNIGKIFIHYTYIIIIMPTTYYYIKRFEERILIETKNKILIY